MGLAVAAVSLIAVAVQGSGPYIHNTEARQSAVCEPESKVVKAIPQGYRGSSDTLAVYCEDGRWTVLNEGYLSEIHQPEFPKGR